MHSHLQLMKYAGCLAADAHVLVTADSSVPLALQMCSMCKMCIMMTALSQQQLGLDSTHTYIRVVDLRRSMCASWSLRNRHYPRALPLNKSLSTIPETYCQSPRIMRLCCGLP